MPIGYLTTTVVFATCVGFAIAAPHPQHSRPWRLSFWLAYVVNEVPFLVFFVLAANTALAAADGDLVTPGGIAGGAIAGLTGVGLVVVVARARRARATLDAALIDGLPGRGAPTSRLRGLAAVRRWARVVLWPFPWWFHPGTVRISNVAYSPGGRAHRLDVYRPRRRPPTGPILLQLHGGAFRGGRKSLESRPLVHRLARHGWVCMSANYRVGRGVEFPDHLIDVKHAIAWAKEHAAELGADPDQLYVAGSSAGGHLACTAAFTPNDPRFQPGFEAADTSVTAAISFYGYYGSIATRGLPSSPGDYVTAAAPPVFVLHGDRDTLVIVEDARAFVRHLRATSDGPVVYAELPGAHHDFDLFHSIRFEAVIDAVEVFAAAVAARAHDGRRGGGAVSPGRGSGRWSARRCRR
jgi:acetyl esterase/lipase